MSALSASAEQIDLNKSTLTWKGSKITGDSHSGPIKLKEATLNNGKGEFVVDMKSMDESYLTGEWKEKFLTHIKSADFFDVEKFPTAKLVIDKMDNGKLEGSLTIKDKVQKITVPYKKVGNKYEGELTFDRTKFGVIYGSGNFFKNLGDKVISDKVSLKFIIAIK